MPKSNPHDYDKAGIGKTFKMKREGLLYVPDTPTMPGSRLTCPKLLEGVQDQTEKPEPAIIMPEPILLFDDEPLFVPPPGFSSDLVEATDLPTPEEARRMLNAFRALGVGKKK